MARAIQIPLGFLSTAIFFAAFFLAGDILIAAAAALFTFIAQFAVSRSARVNPGLSIWASLAIVIALTTLSLRGDDTFASPDATQVNAVQPNCHCDARKQSHPARVTPVPLREAPQAPAPSRDPV